MSTLKILWASPLSPTRSGVADYAAELLPELNAVADVEVIKPPAWRPPPRAAWAKHLRFAPVDAEPTPDQVPLLHLGNNPYHLWVAFRLRLHGGIVVLHDSVLHHLLVEEAAAEGEWPRFGRELEDGHPSAGGALATGRRWGYHGRLDPFLFPARRAFLSHARAAVVHSKRAAQSLRAEMPNMPVRHVPLAAARLPAGNRTRMRERLGVAEDDLVIAHLGYLTPAKGLVTVLRGLSALRQLGVRARLVVVGDAGAGDSLEPHIRALGLGEWVVQWGWASRSELGTIIAAADLGVVPRYPTAGETSAAALRFLAAGRPILISGYAQFLEFPADAAMRLGAGPAGVADFVRHASRLSRDSEACARAGAAARRAWASGDHEPGRAAGRLIEAVEEIRIELAGRG